MSGYSEARNAVFEKRRPHDAASSRSQTLVNAASMTDCVKLDDPKLMVDPIKEAIVPDAIFSESCQVLRHLPEGLAKLGVSGELEYLLPDAAGNGDVELFEVPLEGRSRLHTIRVVHAS